ncbi:MAG: hypothetical protein KC766_39400 [Myxococcales bacterium]|nr:hypothetical protein [Myxococcales bacterium]
MRTSKLLVSLGLSVFALGAVLFSPHSASAGATRAAVLASGTYDITDGRNADGSSYQGLVQVAQTGSVVHLRWDLGGVKNTHQGVGLLDGNRLAVAWTASPSGGVVIYKVHGGTLNGRWASYGSTSEAVENLKGPGGLNGDYRITLGTNEAGGHYTGRVHIAPQGASHALTWDLDSGEHYTGVGVLSGDLLTVGWGAGSGAVVYDIRGDRLNGRWASPGDTKLGKEELKLKARPKAKAPKQPRKQPAPRQKLEPPRQRS